MSDRWRVGAGGNWDDTSHWSASQGGAIGASTPVYTDNAYFDQNSSGTITVAAAAACEDLDFTKGTGFTGTFAGSSALNIGGSLAMNAAMTRTYTGAITFASQNTGKTVTSNGITFGAAVTFNGIGGGWTLQDALTLTAGNVGLTAGTLITNGKAISCASFAVATGTLPRTLDIRGSAITLSGSWSANSSLTLIVDTGSVINLTGNQGFTGAGLTYNDVAYTSALVCALSGTNTFRNLSIAWSSSAGGSATFDSNITVTGTFTATGTASNSHPNILSSVVGTPRALNAAAVSLTDVDFQDITGTGAAAPFTGTRIGDRLGNSGITVATPSTKFWVGGTGNVGDATNHWATTSGGSSGANNYPLPQDEARWDAASNATAYTVTFNQVTVFDTLNFSAAPGTSGTITFAGASSITLYSGFTLLAGMTRTWSGGSITFASRTTGKTYKFNGITLSTAFVFNGIGGGWTQQDNGSISGGQITLTNGSLSFGAHNMTSGGLVCSAGTSVDMSGSTLTITANITFTATTTVTVNTSSIINGASSTFTGAGKTFNDYTTTGSLTSISGANTFRNLTITPTSNTDAALSADQTVTGTFTATGTNAFTRLKILSDVAGTPRTITAATTSLTNVDFTDITGAGAAAWTGTRVGDRKGNSGITFTTPATKFWVGGTGNWSDSTNHWATSSGGLPASNNFPLPQDNVVFDASSSTANAAYTATINVVAFCTDFTLGGPGGGNKVTWAGSSAMTLYGSMNLSGGTAGITNSFTGGLTFAATSTGKTVAMNGVVLASVVAFNGIGGGWTLQDDFNIGSSNNLTLTNGALIVASGKTVTCQQFSSSNSNTRSVDFSGATFALNSSWGMTVSTGATVTVNTGSLITIAGTNSGFNGGGLTYNDVTFNNSGSAGLTGANTFRNLTLTPSGILSVSRDSNITVTGTFTATGLSANQRLLNQSTVLGTSHTITAAAVSLTDADFADTAGAGAATWSGTRLGDAKGNSNITFATPANKFYVGNTANWDATVWALTSGGAAGANNFPLPQDTAVFDVNSFSANSQTVTLNGAFRVPTLDFSAITKTGITLANSTNAVTLYGNVTLESHMAISGTGAYTFSGRNTQTITSSGVAWTQSYQITSVGGTVTFADAHITTGGMNLNSGTLDTANKTMTWLAFSSVGTATRVLNLGSSTVTLGGSNSWNAVSTGLTISAGTSTIKYNPSTAVANTFTGGGFTYNNLWFAPATYSQTNPFPGTYTITGSNTFADLKMDVERGTLLTTTGTTTTVNTLTIGGTAAHQQVFASTSAVASTIAKAGGGTVTVDYVNVANSTASPSSTFSDKPHGVDLGGNTNWDFSATVTHPSSGVLVGAGSVAAGTAAHLKPHPTAGVLVGPGAAAAGVAHRTRLHAAAGSLAGPGSVVIGVAAHIHVPVSHAATGELVGSGAVLAGTARGPGEAAHAVALETKQQIRHDISGRLIGGQALLSGQAEVQKTGQNPLALLLTSN